MVDDDWLHFVGFIIYGFVSTSAHFDSIWFNPIQSNSVSFCFQFRVVLNFISDLFLFVSLGYFVEVMELVELVMVLGSHDDWWMVEGWLAGCGAGICVVRSFEFGQWSWVLIDRVWVCARVSELQSLGEWSCAHTSSAHDLLTLMAFDLLIPCFLSSSLALLIIC